MSSSSITYDVLSMNELKPWWEEVRTYALALMLASSLFLSYNFETSGAVDCRPFNRTSASMESADTSFVNSVCVSDYNSALYTGTLNVVGVVLLYIISNWWLRSFRVRRGISYVRKADELLSATKYLPRVIEEIATQPWNASHVTSSANAASSSSSLAASSAQYYKSQQSQMSNIMIIREAGRKIWLRDTGKFASPGPTMNTLYLIGNIFSFLAVSGLVAATFIMGLRIDDLIFTCTDPASFSGLRHHTYTCVQGVSSQLTSFIVLYYLLGFSQAAISLSLIMSGLSRIRSTSRMSEIEKTMLDNEFLFEFTKRSVEVEESTQLLLTMSYLDLRERVIQAAEADKTDDIYFNDLMEALDLDA